MENLDPYVSEIMSEDSANGIANEAIDFSSPVGVKNKKAGVPLIKAKQKDIWMPIMIGVDIVLFACVFLLVTGVVDFPRVFPFKNSNSQLTQDIVNEDHSVDSTKYDSALLESVLPVLIVPTAQGVGLDTLFTPTEYEKYVEFLADIVTKENPTTALDTMVADMPIKSVVQQNCHSLTHKVGEFALAKYNGSVREAITYNVDICGGGYVHGLIEHFLKTSDNPAVEILSVCENPTDGTCFHGVGHGLMLVNDMNVPDSVAGCMRLTQSAQQLWCGEGVFMENFDSENVAASLKPYLNSANPTGLCLENTGIYRNACFYYAGRYILKVNTDPYDSLQVCKQAPTLSDRQACVRGMSAGIVRAHLLEPVVMEKYCLSVGEYITDCIQGSVNYHLLLLKSNNKTSQDMCQQFTSVDIKSICEYSITVSPFRT